MTGGRETCWNIGSETDSWRWWEQDWQHTTTQRILTYCLHTARSMALHLVITYTPWHRRRLVMFLIYFASHLITHTLREQAFYNFLYETCKTSMINTWRQFSTLKKGKAHYRIQGLQRKSPEIKWIESRQLQQRNTLALFTIPVMFLKIGWT